MNLLTYNELECILQEFYEFIYQSQITITLVIVMGVAELKR